MDHPQAIFVQLTTACNAKCVNCSHSFTYGREKHRFMPEQVWQKSIQDVKDMNYTGQIGLYLHHEPLLDPYLFRKIRQVNLETNAFVVISTNGLLLDERLIEARPRLVHINIVSAEKAQYEKLTGLKFEKVIENVKKFINEAKDQIQIEINCPVLPGVDTERLVRLFHEVKVNIDFHASSRGGLLPGISSAGKNTRFGSACHQPEQNFNILHDGGVILCCNDWTHETKGDFPNIMEKSIQEIYDLVRKADRTKYKMCQYCAKEMGFTCF